MVAVMDGGELGSKRHFLAASRAAGLRSGWPDVAVGDSTPPVRDTVVRDRCILRGNCGRNRIASY
jgi:hypothetical protein